MQSPRQNTRRCVQSLKSLKIQRFFSSAIYILPFVMMPRNPDLMQESIYLFFFKYLEMKAAPPGYRQGSSFR